MTMPTSPDNAYSPTRQARCFALNEHGIEYGFIGKLQGLKYEHRRDITDRAAL
jgi:type I restriction enzyme R subunit